MEDYSSQPQKQYSDLNFSDIDIEVPSRVDGKRRNLARVSDFVSWDEACGRLLSSKAQGRKYF